MEMRKVFSHYMMERMAEDGRLCVLDADLGSANSTLELRQRYPDRAFDVGIAEQNMAGVAAGLSAYGMIPFITTFACFASRRICDQIAISCAYAKQHVKIVGSDPGITAEHNGGTHMAIEDLGVLRSIPELVLFEPCDEAELLSAMPQIIEHPGTVYLRLHRKELPAVHDEAYQCSLLQADPLSSGTDVTLLASGGIMVGYTLQAAELLAGEGISAEVINVHTVKPLDQETILASLRKTGAAVTCENHSVIGGLYSAVCEAAAAACPVPVRPVGFQDVFGEVGRLEELAKKKGMLPSDIVRAAKDVIRRRDKGTGRFPAASHAQKQEVF